MLEGQLTILAAVSKSLTANLTNIYLGFFRILINFAADLVANVAEIIMPSEY